MSERGRNWIAALADELLPSRCASVLRADGKLGEDRARLIAVVPDPNNSFARARNGEVGIREAVGLADEVRSIIRDDASTAEAHRRPLVAVVDLPSQAYGTLEEALGIHLAIAAAVDAYASARNAGHPVIALIVGSALSGGFLAHGLQATQIIALDDPGVTIHAMNQAAAARVTRRTREELVTLGQVLKPLSYSVRGWASLGYCDDLLQVAAAEDPTPSDVITVKNALVSAISRARQAPHTLDRLRSPAARTMRLASCRVRAAVAAQWD